MKMNFIKMVAVAAAATFFVACQVDEYNVTVKNALDCERVNETVELDLAY